MKDKKVLVGITGSIAAYKIVELTRMLIKEGAEVRIVMTSAAKDFVSTLTLSTLSKNPVVSEIFRDDSWTNHVMYGRWADVFIIAPLSCNTLSKMVHGGCDSMVLATYLSSVCPVVVAPAMDEDMWNHPSTVRNLELLRKDQVHIIDVGNGELASGLIGNGRMAEPEEIFQYVKSLLFKDNRFLGKRFLVTAGPTYEPMDPVRFIGNYSSGKMGIAIASELSKRGGEVELVIGPHHEKIDLNSYRVHQVSTSDQMYEKCIELFSSTDVAILSAAVADYKPEVVKKEKIKKDSSEEMYHLKLVRTKDILKTLGQMKQPSQLTVGFALETENERANARLKMKEKNADMIVLNSLRDEGAGFGLDTNKITIISSSGEELGFETKSKMLVARDIVDSITKLLYD